MHRKSVTAWKSLAAVLVAVSPGLMAQEQPASDDLDSDVYILSPFVVQSSEDMGYRADATLAGTRIRTELKDVGSAISVVTEQFMSDTGSTKAEELLVYATNTEVAGIQGSFTGGGAGAYIDNSAQRIRPNQSTRVRGLTSADNTRDFFLTDIPWDSYNVSRIDLQRGPNAILFGLGSPAGIINASVDGASFENDVKLETRIGSYGSNRASLNINRVILPDELAIRVAGLYNDTKYQQEPAYERDKRFFTAAEYNPAFLNKGTARTSFRVKYESGDIEGNRPRIMPPLDAITPWFTEMNRQGYNPRTVGETDDDIIAALVAAGDLGAGARQDGEVTTNPWLGNASRMYDNPAVIFTDADAVNQTTSIMSSSNHITTAVPSMDIGWMTWNGVRVYSLYAPKAGLVGSSIGAYKDRSLTDASVFNFYDTLIDGPNKHEWQKWNTLNFAASQTFLSNKLGVEYVYDKQDYEDGGVEWLDGFAEQLTIDINTHLLDGSTNPNFGRPYVVSDSSGNSMAETMRETHRITGFGELDFREFMNEESWITKFLGRHTFTGLWSESKTRDRNKSWHRFVTDSSFGEAVDSPGINSPNRLVATVTYLGPSLANATSASGANIPGIKVKQVVRDMDLRWYDTTWVTDADPDALYIKRDGSEGTQRINPGNYAGWTTRKIGVWNSDDPIDRSKTYSNAQKVEETITSEALIWQGYWWDNNIVTTVGWRTDQAKSYDAGSPPKNNQAVDWNSAWVIPDEPTNDVKGSSTSYSIVAHTPNFLKEKMPAGTNVSLFYNESSNFQPAAGRVDVLGDAIGAPSGKTYDYGFVLNTLNDTLSFKVNFYKTTVKDASLDDFGGRYMIGAAEAWGYMFAKRAIEGVGDWAEGYRDPGGDATEATLAEQAQATAAYMAGIDQHMFDVYQIDTSLWDSWMGWTDPTGIAITGDTESEGTEYELLWQPNRNWSISVNASETSATRINMAGSLKKWVEDRWEFYQGPAGLVRLWGPWYSPGETIRGKFGREMMGPYNLYTMQEGADVPELRPWRFGAVVNYTFTEGRLKGLNVGGSYRWADEIIIGYGVLVDGEGNESYDINAPIKGDAETNLDLWAGYQTMLTDKIEWRVQLNLRNVGQDNDLIPITANPDGTPAAYRIQNEMTWSLTNTFSF